MNNLNEFVQIFEFLPKSKCTVVAEIYAKKARDDGLPKGEFDAKYRELTERKHGVERRALRREISPNKLKSAMRTIRKCKDKAGIVDDPEDKEQSLDDNDNIAELNTNAKYWVFVVGEKLATEVARILKEKKDELE
jgi:hypothetical protein